MKLVFDIEANGLLPTVSKFHCAGAKDVDTGEEYWFRPHQLKEFLELLDKADTIIAHNAFGYDVPALKILGGWTCDPAKVQCTKVMSQVLNYKRFVFGHSLKRWGEELSNKGSYEHFNLQGGMTERSVYAAMAKQKESMLKGDYNGGWEEFNEDMFEYMKQDVRLGADVYVSLIQELKCYMKKVNGKSILKALRLEMELDRIMVEQSQNGWKFNLEEAKELSTYCSSKMSQMERFINSKLGLKVESPDGSVLKAKELIEDAVKAKKDPNDISLPIKSPKFTKGGDYHSHTKSWFGLTDNVQYDLSRKHTLPVWGEYCRVQFSGGDIGNTATVKTYLSSIGWVPDEWNWKRVDGKFIKVSAKLSDSSLKPLGEVGETLMEYYTLRSRQSIIKGWFEHVDDDNRLHGDCFNVGTPTFRQTHKIIANLPSGKAALGPEIRKLFVAESGYKLVSADSAACQLRLLAHFMQDKEFTREVLEGDIHQKNADILGCSRPTAKPFIFAFLYGAGGKKLGSILGCSEREGNAVKKKFLNAIPSLKALIEKCQKIVDKQKFIVGLDDRPIYTESSHKALNYLIQGAEAVVMKATVAMIDVKLKEANIDFKHLLFYHDEHTVEVREDQAEEAREIIMRCFEEAPKPLGVNIMTCGDCKIGDDYYDVH